MEHIIPGVYSEVDDSIAQAQSKEQMRSFYMSIEKIIIGPNGEYLKVFPDGTLGTWSTCKTVKTHTDVGVEPESTLLSDWVDTNGFTALTASVRVEEENTPFALSFDLYWSHDKNTTDLYTPVDGSYSGDSQMMSRGIYTRARYVRIALKNISVDKLFTVSSWIYLKSR